MQRIRIVIAFHARVGGFSRTKGMSAAVPGEREDGVNPKWGCKIQPCPGFTDVGRRGTVGQLVKAQFRMQSAIKKPLYFRMWEDVGQWDTGTAGVIRYKSRIHIN